MASDVASVAERFEKNCVIPEETEPLPLDEIPNPMSTVFPGAYAVTEPSRAMTLPITFVLASADAYRF